MRKILAILMVGTSLAYAKDKDNDDNNVNTTNTTNNAYNSTVNTYNPTVDQSFSLSPGLDVAVQVYDSQKWNLQLAGTYIVHKSFVAGPRVLFKLAPDYKP